MESNLRVIPRMLPGMINKVYELEDTLLKLPQSNIATEHSIHAGMYTRTVLLPKGTVITGALIKRSTTLIIAGTCVVTLGDEVRKYTGYAVINASANRKQGFLAIEDTYLTMCFATSARTVEEAEREFTDDYADLLSRCPDQKNIINITGE